MCLRLEIHVLLVELIPFHNSNKTQIRHIQSSQEFAGHTKRSPILVESLYR